ncbi:MAG TPA: tetratricopeptide repeat protein [Bacteroidia bacterium]|nr:tetratricopeptide repeat protein [Bacteroidia bacterium]
MKIKKHKTNPSSDSVSDTGNTTLTKHKTILSLICAVLGILLYAGTLTHDYAVDDGTVMENNKIVKKGISSIPEIFSTAYRAGFWERYEGVYRPMSVAMFAIEWELSPENAWLGHFMNVLLYGLTGFLLFQTLCKLFAQQKVLIPFAVTLLFMAHPLHSEVVANIKSRDEILCFLFAILSFRSLLNYIDQKNMLTLLLSGLWFFLALLSKENAITLLPLFALIIFYKSENNLPKAIQNSWMFFAVTALYFLIRFMVLGSLKYDVEILPINNSLVTASGFAERIGTAFYIMALYFKLFLLPHPLVFDYSYNTIPITGFAHIGSLLGLVLYVGLAVYAIKSFLQKNWIAFGIIFFLVTSSLVSNLFIMIESTMGERFLYMPSIGLCIALIFFMDKLINKNKNTHAPSIASMFAHYKTFMIGLFVLLALFSFKTITRAADWKNNFTLLEKDVVTSPESARIRYAYGSALLIEKVLAEDGEKDPIKKNAFLAESIKQLEKGVSILHSYSDAWYHLALAYKESNDGANAVRAFETAKSMKDFKDDEFFVSSGLANAMLKKYDAAIADYNKALELNPKSSEAYNNYGIALTDINKLQEALDVLNKALELKPDFEAALYNLGNVYAKAGDFNTAISYYDKAIALDPNYSEAYNNKGNSYASMNQFDQAVLCFEKVTQLNPNDPKALYNLGVTYHLLGNEQKAQEYINRSRSMGGTQ